MRHKMMKNLKDLAAQNNFLTPGERDNFFKESQVSVELPTKESCMDLESDPFILYMYERVQESALADADGDAKRSKCFNFAI